MKHHIVLATSSYSLIHNVQKGQIDSEEMVLIWFILKGHPDITAQSSADCSIVFDVCVFRLVWGMTENKLSDI